jgi:chromosomal replication initiation ATPase DnaA
MKKTNINPFLSFSNFILVDGNSKVHKEAISFLENKDKNNILLIGGFNGCGKSHFLNALGNFCIEKKKNTQLFDSSELINLIRKDELKKQCEEDEIVLFDDIDYVSKTNIKDFVENCKWISEKGKKIVATFNEADKQNIESLKSLLNPSIVFFEKPTINSVMRICYNFCEERKIRLSEDALLFICNRNSTGNIHKLMNDIYLIDMYKEPNRFHIITTTDIKSILISQIDNNKKESKFYNNPETLINSVCNYFYFDKKVLLKKTKRRDVINIRNICIYGLSRFYHLEHKNIAKIFKIKSLSTINVILSKME